MDLIERKKKLLMAQDQFVPPGFTVYDYIQAQGDRAVIDTGVSGNNDNLKFHMLFNVDRYIQYRGLFTNYSSEKANCWRLSESATNNSFLFATNTKTGSSGTKIVGSYVGKNVEAFIDKTSVSFFVDGTEYTSASPTTAGTSNSNNIFINSSRTYAQTRDDVIKWYFFKIWDNGKLIRNYVPVKRKSDNKCGFYDTVNHTFNPSIGSVDFVAGND